MNDLEEKLRIAQEQATKYQGAQKVLEEMVTSGNAMQMDDGTLRPIFHDPNAGDHYVQMGNR